MLMTPMSAPRPQLHPLRTRSRSPQRSAMGPMHVMLSLVCAWLFLIGANSSIVTAPHGCECPSTQTTPSHAHAEHEEPSAQHADHNASSCACGAESPSDCHCEFNPHDPSSTSDVITWVGSFQFIGVKPPYPVQNSPSFTAGFSSDTPPGNWLYGRPPPVSIYLLHRTLLI